MTLPHIPAGQWVVVAPQVWRQDRIVLGKEDYRHLVLALRLRSGDVVGVLDGGGGVARAELADVSKESAALVVRERHRVAEPRPHVILCIALLREAAMDTVIQNAVELGARRLIVFDADRSVVKCSGEKAEKRLARWLRLVVNAARQCGRPWLPMVEGISSLSAVLCDMSKTEVRWYGSLASDATLLREAVRMSPSAKETVAVFVGPEGDFSPDEEQALRASGALPVSFGAGVLRAETAAAFVLSVLRYEFADEENPFIPRF